MDNQPGTSASCLDVERPVEWSPDLCHFKFNREIGRGGFKVVYRGMDSRSMKLVAWGELLVGISF